MRHPELTAHDWATTIMGITGIVSWNTPHSTRTLFKVWTDLVGKRNGKNAPFFLSAHLMTVNKGNLRMLQILGRKEGNVLFNDALITFYLRLYGVRHMVKDHSDSERGNPLLPHGLLFSINSKCSFICTIPQTG